MASSIPASAIVNVLPSVITAGGSGLDLVGLFLTTSAQAPTNTLLSFSSAGDVSTYFGPLSSEALAAADYFGGYTGSAIKPARLNFYRYVASAAAAFLRGANMGLTLDQLKALSGVLTVTVGSTAKTSANIDLSTATSFSNAASIITSAFTSPGFTVSYDSVSGGFVFTTAATGAAATLTYASGTLSAGLGLTAAAGATLSQGADVVTPATAMAAVLALSTDWVSFSTVFEPQDSDKVVFAAWAHSKGSRYLYVPWGNPAAAVQENDTTSWGALMIAAGYGSIVPIFDPTNGLRIAAFLMGAIASIDFSRTNGRATMAFRSGTVPPGVTNETIANNLSANGYNFIGSYATANDAFTFLYPGQVTGEFNWIDSWYSQVWMNNAFQLQLMTLLTSVPQIPYNAEGYSMISASLQAVVVQALNFGAIRAGVTLSEQQKAEVNNLAGGDVAGTLEQQGFYIQVKDPGAQVRAQRGSPICTVFYCDGQSVQKITLASVQVQ